MILRRRHGKLAREHGFTLELQVLQSAAGFYIGTADESGPVSRESEQYYPTREAAQFALDAPADSENSFFQRWEV